MKNIPKKKIKNLDPKLVGEVVPGEGPMRKIARLPQSEQARMEKALADLMKKRATEANRTGKWPNYNTN